MRHRRLPLRRLLLRKLLNNLNQVSDVGDGVLDVPDIVRAVGDTSPYSFITKRFK